MFNSKLKKRIENLENRYFESVNTKYNVGDVFRGRGRKNKHNWQLTILKVNKRNLLEGFLTPEYDIQFINKDNGKDIYIENPDKSSQDTVDYLIDLFKLKKV